jgi:hypothetical protein
MFEESRAERLLAIIPVSTDFDIVLDFGTFLGLESWLEAVPSNLRNEERIGCFGHSGFFLGAHSIYKGGGFQSGSAKLTASASFGPRLTPQ